MRLSIINNLCITIFSIASLVHVKTTNEISYLKDAKIKYLVEYNKLINNFKPDFLPKIKLIPIIIKDTVEIIKPLEKKIPKDKIRQDTIVRLVNDTSNRKDTLKLKRKLKIVVK